MFHSDYSFVRLIAVLTGAGGRASKRSLIVRFTVSGQVPCSGAERRGKVLDAVSTAIHGGAAAVNYSIIQKKIYILMLYIFFII